MIPRSRSKASKRETPWDDIHVTYFVGEALWTYLNTPFLYTHDGFVTEEIASIQVDGEIWRRLKVTFPRLRKEPYSRANLLLRAGWTAAAARLHGRHTRWCNRPQLRL